MPQIVTDTSLIQETLSEHISPTPSSTVHQFTTALCGTVWYVSGLRPSGENTYQRSTISTSLTLLTPNGQVFTSTKSGSDGSFILSAPPGVYTAVISPYDIKQEVVIQSGSCTKKDLFINTP